MLSLGPRGVNHVAFLIESSLNSSSLLEAYEPILNMVMDTLNYLLNSSFHTYVVNCHVQWWIQDVGNGGGAPIHPSQACGEACGVCVTQ